MIKKIKALIYEYCHRELFDHYYVHPDFVHKDLRIIPKWQYYLYEWIITYKRTWRYQFHGLGEFLENRRKRYVDNRKIYNINSNGSISSSEEI